jgi:hypothetical protein
MSPPFVISIGCGARKRVYARCVLQNAAVAIRESICGGLRMTMCWPTGYMARRRNSPTKYREPVMQMTSDGAAFAIAAARACVESGMTVK